MSDTFLDGRAALVTGGASGMGRAIALALASAGADVAIGSRLREGEADTTTGEVVYLPGRSELDATAGEIEALGASALAMGLDVASMDSVRGFCDAAAARFGKVDILVNAAGITAEHTIAGHDDALWDRVIEVNLTGTYRTITLCLPGMIERKWGRIVNIASTAAAVGAATSGAYCASKAAVVGLSRCVALEGAAHGVTCNAISPTWVETASQKLMNRAPLSEASISRVPALTIGWLPTRPTTIPPMRANPMMILLAKSGCTSKKSLSSTRRSMTRCVSMGSLGDSGTSSFMPSSSSSSRSSVGRWGESITLLDGRKDKRRWAMAMAWRSSSATK